ncbi:MAG TPA: Calx-beta domain-containing protein [Thermoanaerobaculia bacterium]|nr:Calx-beta domain-containing protein [Thermoanaerobaculia bacterium]
MPLLRKSLQIAGLAAWVLLGTAAARAQYDDPGPGPGGGQSCASGDVLITAQDNNRWSPSQVTVQVGQTICVRNPSSSIPHNFNVSGVVRCAGACSSNTSSSTTTPRTNWTSRLSFTAAGVLNFHCDEHVAMGMTGQITVQAAGGGGNDSPGALSFTASNYSVSEAGGNATITVRRTGGDDGAVSVQYATANGTATAGSDYTAKTGTLSWPDNDDNNKSFTVAIANDTADESNETVQLSLSNPTGGATLGSPASATLTITDNDGGGGGGGGGGTAPAAPSNLRATALSTTEIRLAWNDNSNNETQFLIERRPIEGGAFVQVGTAPVNATELTAGGLAPATGYVFRVRAANATGNSAYSNTATAATNSASTGPCVEDADTLCLNNDRFRVEVTWRTAAGSGNGTGVPLDFAPDSGLFYFFSASNVELLIKVLNACAPPFDRFWIFFAATTNVEFKVTVTDTQSAKVKMYFNPLNNSAAPIQDTDAFDTCP